MTKEYLENRRETFKREIDYAIKQLKDYADDFLSTEGYIDPEYVTKKLNEYSNNVIKHNIEAWMVTTKRYRKELHEELHAKEK